MRSLGCFLSSCREVTTNRNDRRLLNAILRLACSQFNAIEGERDREMAGSGVFDACQFESELSFRVAKSFFAFKCRSYRLANLTKVARAASTVLIDVSKSILNFRLSANISNPSLSIPVIVTASTAVTFNTLLDIGENRRLKPAIFAAFFTFSVKLFEFADSNEVG